MLWATCVVPALFPFFVLSKLLIDLGWVTSFSDKIAPITKKLFRAPAISGYVFAVSILSGYPVGAKMIEESYKKGLLNQTNCKKLATFCSTSGPLFILGTVGAKFFGNAVLGTALFAVHFASALLTGLCFRNFYTDVNPTKPVALPPRSDVLNNAVYQSVGSILTVGAFISLFYMLTDMLLSVYPTTAIPPVVVAFLNGLLEVTRGCKEVAFSASPQAAFVLCSCLVSFGGLCIFSQSFTYLKNCGVRFREFFIIKCVQAAISTIVAYGVSVFLF